MKKKKKEKKNLVILLITIFVLLLLCCALFIFKKSDNGNGGIINSLTYKVALDNNSYKELSGSVTPTSVDILDTGMKYSIPLKNANEYYQANIKIVNKGGVTAKLKGIEITGLTDEQRTYIQHQIKFNDYAFLQSSDKLDFDLKPGESATIEVYVLASQPVNLDGGLNLGFNLKFKKKK